MRKIILLTVFIFLSTFSKGVTMELTPKTTDSLKLEIDVEEKMYSVEDILKIRYTITNISKKDIFFVNWDRGYEARWIRIYDSNGKKMPWERKIIYEFTQYLNKETYIALRPQEEFIVYFVAKLIMEKERLLVDFENSAIPLEGEGDYFIKGKYVGLSLWKEDGERLYGLSNVWVGEIESKEIKIVVNEGTDGK